jgi:hypothetical protein
LLRLKKKEKVLLVLNSEQSMRKIHTFFLILKKGINFTENQKTCVLSVFVWENTCVVHFPYKKKPSLTH